VNANGQNISINPVSMLENNTAESIRENEEGFPYRVCIAGGWIDQPWVSKLHPGSVVVAQVRPTVNFNDRSGMATSSRKIALELWEGKIPGGDPLRNAKMLFGAENPPGSKYISGSQDHLGLLMPGINRLYYKGDFWPSSIDSCRDPEICHWLESVLYLIPMEPRPEGFDPIAIRNLDKSSVKELGDSGNECWESILNRDVYGLGKALTKSFLAWRKILPHTVPDEVMRELETKYLPNYPGAITSGSGGGYVLVASDREIPGSIRIKVKF
jgi:hypothetical protein